MPPPNSPILTSVSAAPSDTMAPSSRPAASGSTAIDLRALDYLPPYDHHLICLICHCPFIDPVRLDCDHFFCKTCIDTHIHNTYLDEEEEEEEEDDVSPSITSFSCPTCRAEIDLPLKKAPRLIGVMCDDISVRCPYWKEGCGEVVRRGLAKLHAEKYCRWRRVRCPGDQHNAKVCERVIPAIIAEEPCKHGNSDQEEDSGVDRKCSRCFQLVNGQTMEDHIWGSCPSAFATCPYCSVSVRYCQLTSHKARKCSEMPLPCTASSIGCPEKFKRTELPGHESECPLARLTPFLQAQEEQMHDMKETIESLRLKNEALENKDTLAQQEGHHCAMAQNKTEDAADDNVQPPRDRRMPPSPPTSTEATYTNMSQTQASYLLGLQESLRVDLSRVTGLVRDIDHRLSFAIMNDGCVLREEIRNVAAGLHAVSGQVGWLMSSRLRLARATHNNRVVSAMPAPTVNTAATANPPLWTATALATMANTAAYNAPTGRTAMPAFVPRQNAATGTQSGPSQGSSYTDNGRRRAFSEATAPWNKL